jgi:hypothetical protein
MNESPIFSKTYDLLLWLVPQTTKFPRQHRFGLGEHILHHALDFQDKLLAASLSPANHRLSLLQEADIQLAQLRLNLRLCKDLELFTLKQYEHTTAMLVEIGRLLGGWQKTLKTG